MPRFNATAWSGDDAVTAGDVLLPLAGSDIGVFYTDFQGKYGDETTWMLGAGAGYRRTIDEAEKRRRKPVSVIVYCRGV